MSQLEPRLEVLLAAQRTLWPELRTLFGPAFNPVVAQKALAYFEGGDLSGLPMPSRELLVREAIRPVQLPVLPRASERLD